MSKTNQGEMIDELIRNCFVHLVAVHTATQEFQGANNTNFQW